MKSRCTFSASVQSISFVTLLFCSMWFAPSRSFGASATGTATITVVKSLSIVSLSPLAFPQAAVGDPAATVDPGTAENNNNASFTVSGEPNLAYTISLPSDGTVTMITGAGGNGKTIAVNGFKSYPAAGANGLLSGSGTQLLLVGATRAALPTTQTSGAYTGTFTVTVVY